MVQNYDVLKFYRCIFYYIACMNYLLTDFEISAMSIFLMSGIYVN